MTPTERHQTEQRNTNRVLLERDIKDDQRVQAIIDMVDIALKPQEVR